LIFLTADKKHRLGLQCREIVRRLARRRRDRGQDLTALRPEQKGKVAATRVSDRIDALFIDLVVQFQAREQGVEEFQIAITLVALPELPARLLPLEIDESPRCIER